MITLPEETGTKHYSILVFKGKRFQNDIEEYFEWKTHSELQKFIEEYPTECVGIKTAVGPWVIRNLKTYGNCLLGREYPIPMQKFNLELKNYGLRVKSTKKNGFIRLDVIK